MVLVVSSTAGPVLHSAFGELTIRFQTPLTQILLARTRWRRRAEVTWRNQSAHRNSQARPQKARTGSERLLPQLLPHLPTACPESRFSRPKTPLSGM
jgi:hypothetical protein